MVLKNPRVLEGIFLVVFIGIFLWMSLGPILEYKLVHDMPTGFGGGDAYFWFTNGQYIHDYGSFSNNPFFLDLGLRGMVSPAPPLFPQLVAYFSYAFGLPVYDAQVLLGVLILVFAALIFFILIKEYNPLIAYLSLPLFVFLFTFPFFAGLVFGFYSALLGFLLLFASLFIMFHFDVKHSAIILSVLISAVILSHSSRLFEFAFLAGSFILLGLLYRKVDLVFIRKFLVSCFFGLVISFYYLPVLLKRFFVEKGANFAYSVSEGAKYLNIKLGDFELIQYVIIIGLFLCLYLLFKERDTKSFVLAFPVVSVLLVYLLRVGRVYQSTFLWPVLLGVAFGVAVFFVLKLGVFSKVNKNVFFCMALSLIISLFFVYQYYYLYRGPVLESISEIGTTTTQGQWDNLVWLSENTPADSRILFFYFNDNPSDIPYLLLSSERTSFYVPLDRLDDAISQNVTKKDYGILDTSDPDFYKRLNLFSVVSVDKNQYLKNWSVCDFDYIYGKAHLEIVTVDGKKYVTQQVQSRVLYTLNLFSELVKSGNFVKVHENDEAYIIKNNNPGGDCIE